MQSTIVRRQGTVVRLAAAAIAGVAFERYNAANSSLSVRCDSAVPIVAPVSWWQRHLTWFIPLPIPRTLVHHDAIFVHNKKLLAQRERDAEQIRNLLPSIQQARQSRDMQALNDLAHRIASITYGKNVTPQDREDFLARYGCTGWTFEVLETILKLGKDRGIVEMGAGHGQWARALNELYQQGKLPVIKEFVTAYDTMKALPLNASLYRNTQPAHDHFYTKVQPCINAFQVMEQQVNNGRVLMLVFPSSDMVMECLKAYVSTGEQHDTMIYVGEGRGGANAPEEFFDYLEANQWIVLQVIPVKSFGTKGFEKMYILKRPVSREEPSVFAMMHMEREK